jgi:hypothetical protein
LRKRFSQERRVRYSVAKEKTTNNKENPSGREVEFAVQQEKGPVHTWEICAG